MRDYGLPTQAAFSSCVIGYAQEPFRSGVGFAKEDAMLTPSTRRIRVSSKFVCSRCGSREAYCCEGRSPFERYVLNRVMVQPIRCCDCDRLCYAFPVRAEGHPESGTRRTALVSHAA